jgi:hypothetical protein
LNGDIQTTIKKVNNEKCEEVVALLDLLKISRELKTLAANHLRGAKRRSARKSPKEKVA